MKKVLMIIGGITAAGILGIVALVALFAFAMESTSPSLAAPDTSADTALEDEPVVKADAKPEPKSGSVEEPLTASQDSAIRSAKDYLDTAAFSKSGLVEQLEFEGYPTADAQFAVDSLTSADVDWYEQAQKSAKDYMDMSGFSRSGLIEQLMFEGYTRDQAEAGAASVGLN